MRHETPELSLELVSVVIPCYKQAHFLGEAIKASSRKPTQPRK